MTPKITREAARKILSALPRCSLAYLPTPFEPLKVLSERLGVNLWIKRDDQTGLALGGNKARKLEFVMADAIELGADSVITWAGLQSNWCRQLAAASCKLGLRPILFLFKRNWLPDGFDGNYLLDFIADAEIHVVDLHRDQDFMLLEEVEDCIGEVVERERKAGRTPYVAPIGGSLVEGSMSRPLGALGYVNAYVELLDQLDEQGVRMDSIIFATGSGSTQAGLLVGAQLFSLGTRVVGISVGDDAATMTRYVEDIAHQTMREFVFGRPIPASDIIVLDSYMGEGYGMLDRKSSEAIRLMASAEGIYLDPVYSGKAWAGLLELISLGYFRKGENIVFLHTGGSPAIYPYREDFRNHLRQHPQSVGV